MINTNIDPAMRFENVIAKYWGHKNLTVYYSSFWVDLNIVNKLLYSILFQLTYCSKSNQYPNNIKMELEQKCSEMNELNEIPKDEERKNLKYYLSIVEYLETFEIAAN